MKFISLLSIYAFIIGTFIYTISFSLFVWKQKNKIGSIAIMLLALAALVLPIYTMITRG